MESRRLKTKSKQVERGRDLASKGSSVDESADTRPLRPSSSWQPSTMEVLAGSGTEGFADGAGAAAQFNEPIGVAVDGGGNIIIADFSNHCVRKIIPEGTVSTLAGSGNEGFADGAGAPAQFNCPYGVAVDGEGNVIVTDLGNHRVRKGQRNETCIDSNCGMSSCFDLFHVPS